MPSEMPSEMPPYNARVVAPFDASAESATINVFTGMSDMKTLTKARERAVYDPEALNWAPLASSASGPLFPGAVEAKATVESSLRERPSTFKGPQQLDVDAQNADAHMQRMLHPHAWTESPTGTWYREKGDLPFHGFPNPNMHYLYTDAIPTHHLQTLSHAQITDAMRSAANGGFNHDNYFKRVGELMKSGAIPDAERDGASASRKFVARDRGSGGINSDPRLVQKLAEEYEDAFERARRMRVDAASTDPRSAGALGLDLQAESQAFQEEQETQFSRVLESTGVYSGFAQPKTMHI
jgi:hypothetical protein